MNRFRRYQFVFTNPFGIEEEDGRKFIYFQLPRFYKMPLSGEWKKIYSWWYHIGYFSIRRWADESYKECKEEGFKYD